MLFTSGSFIVLVLATMALFYVPLLRRWQTGVLIVSSLAFYSLNQIAYLPLLLASIALNAFTSYAIYYSKSLPRARLFAVLGLVANLGILCFFKYSGLLGHSLPDPIAGPGGPGHWLLMITLPVGISFFTFEGISLVVDTFKARDEKTFFGVTLLDRKQHLASTTLFISFFPHLVAGPILKAHDFYPQIKPKAFREIDWAFCFRKLVMGYFLKMVIADSLKDYTFWIQYPYFQRTAGIELAVLLFGFSMQIFADFAGYSLIAIGVAALFGYRLPENFNFPYISQSFSEFWRRWHISLSSWLKEYLYFPLGGNRRGNFRTYFNLFVVMFLGGLWHGAAWSYAVWGSVHGLALAIERFVTRRQKSDAPPAAWLAPLKILLVFTVVTAAWLLFKLPNFSEAVMYVQAMARNWSKSPDRARVASVLLFSLPVVMYHLGYLLIGEASGEKAGVEATPGWRMSLARMQPLAAPVMYGTMLFLLLVNSGSSGDFIYFQF